MVSSLLCIEIHCFGSRSERVGSLAVRLHCLVRVASELLLQHVERELGSLAHRRLVGLRQKLGKGYCLGRCGRYWALELGGLAEGKLKELAELAGLELIG